MFHLLFLKPNPYAWFARYRLSSMRAVNLTITPWMNWDEEFILEHMSTHFPSTASVTFSLRCNATAWNLYNISITDSVRWTRMVFLIKLSIWTVVWIGASLGCCFSYVRFYGFSKALWLRKCTSEFENVFFIFKFSRLHSTLLEGDRAARGLSLLLKKQIRKMFSRRALALEVVYFF